MGASKQSRVAILDSEHLRGKLACRLSPHSTQSLDVSPTKRWVKGLRICASKDLHSCKSSPENRLFSACHPVASRVCIVSVSPRCSRLVNASPFPIPGTGFTEQCRRKKLALARSGHSEDANDVPSTTLKLMLFLPKQNASISALRSCNLRYCTSLTSSRKLPPHLELTSKREH